ncbi:kinase-like domain-containing protein, partial [Apodospora peruviana]
MPKLNGDLFHLPYQLRPSSGQLLNLLWKCMNQMLSALNYLEGLAIVHCDLKPDNILYKTEPDGKTDFILADFGQSTTVKESKRKGWKAGTPGYQAPEMFWGRFEDHSTKMDVFSLFVSIVEMVPGSAVYK